MLTLVTCESLSTFFFLISTPTFHILGVLLIATEGFGSSSTHTAFQTNTHTLSLSHTQVHTHNKLQSKQEKKLQSESMAVKTAEWRVDVDWSRQNKLNWNHLLYWRSAFNYPLMRQRQQDGLWERERGTLQEEGGERGGWRWRRGRMKREGVGFFLAAITIQSGWNVCGTKWSVMGNTLLQLHIEGERRQQIGQRQTRSEGVQREIDR